ncbi:MAG: BatD family protein [Salibacteraceae bacterium]
MKKIGNSGMKNYFKYTLLIILISVGLNGLAQKFTATVNQNTITVGHQFKVTYSIDGQGENFQIPPFENFRVLSGPNQSTSMQYVNGQMSSSISYSYILASTKTGQFTIPPATVTVNGKKIESNAINISIVNQSQAQKQAAQQKQAQQRAQQKQLEENIYIKLLLDKTSVYQGEQIVATFKLYTRLQVANFQFSKAPAFNGFYTQEIESKEIGQGKTEIINGVQYTTALLKQVVLSPQRSGNIKIEPAEMDVIVRVQDQRAARSFFDQFLGGFKDIEMNLKSNGANIKVKAVPSGNKPLSFNGAVGNFKLTSSIDKQNVKTNEAFNLKVNIAGSGNIKLIKDPKFDFPPDFEVYDPKENTKLNTNARGSSGSKSFEYLIIPRHSGDFVIPSVEFSFFNAKTGKYEVLRTEEYPIHVDRAEGETEEQAATAVRPVRKKDVALLGKDIRFIKKGNPKLKESGSAFFGSKLFWLLFIIPIILFVGLLIVRKRLKEMQMDVVGMNRRKANKVAAKYLTNAKKQLDNNNTNEFYEDVFKSLHKYIGMKMNIPVSDLNKEIMAMRLKEHGVEEGLINSFLEILGECEMARYAPSAAMNGPELFEKTSKLINEIDGGIK